jgi:hypothetical protein
MEALIEPVAIRPRPRGNGPETKSPPSRPAPIPTAWLRIDIPCPLCRETISARHDSRPVEVCCPGCGMIFPFDPWQEPLAVPGVRLASLKRKEPPPADRRGLRLRATVGSWALGLLAVGLAAAGTYVAAVR